MKKLEPEEKKVIQEMLNIAANNAMSKVNYLIKIAFFWGVIVTILVCVLLTLSK